MKNDLTEIWIKSNLWGFPKNKTLPFFRLTRKLFFFFCFKAANQTWPLPPPTELRSSSCVSTQKLFLKMAWKELAHTHTKKISFTKRFQELWVCFTAVSHAILRPGIKFNFDFLLTHSWAWLNKQRGPLNARFNCVKELTRLWIVRLFACEWESRLRESSRLGDGDSSCSYSGCSLTAEHFSSVKKKNEQTTGEETRGGVWNSTHFYQS